jgi:CheY-like chemotaxis protein
MSKSLHILLIEDDRIEVMKFNRVLDKLGTKHKIFEANNGQEALAIIKNKSILPNIIILDLNMPILNGLDFLTILKKDKSLKYIPAIILSTSCNHKDMLECYKLGIAGYMLKPLKFEEYEERITALLAYWSRNELIVQ